MYFLGRFRFPFSWIGRKPKELQRLEAARDLPCYADAVARTTDMSYISVGPPRVLLARLLICVGPRACSCGTDGWIENLDVEQLELLAFAARAIVAQRQLSSERPWWAGSLVDTMAAPRGPQSCKS